MREGYDQEVSVLRGKGKEAAVEVLPRASGGLVTKTMAEISHQGAVSFQHLDYYLG